MGQRREEKREEERRGLTRATPRFSMAGILWPRDTGGGVSMEKLS